MARYYGVAIVFSDSADWPYTEELTAGYVYLRLHGSPETYASPYSDAALDRWAERIRTWRDGGLPCDTKRITNSKPPPRKTRDIYVYFDNDKQAHAPRDALRLAARLGLGSTEDELRMKNEESRMKEFGDSQFSILNSQFTIRL